MSGKIREPLRAERYRVDGSRILDARTGEVYADASPTARDVTPFGPEAVKGIAAALNAALMDLPWEDEHTRAAEAKLDEAEEGQA